MQMSNLPHCLPSIVLTLLATAATDHDADKIKRTFSHPYQTGNSHQHRSPLERAIHS